MLELKCSTYLEVLGVIFREDLFCVCEELGEKCRIGEREKDKNEGKENKGSEYKPICYCLLVMDCSNSQAMVTLIYIIILTVLCTLVIG